VVGYLEWRERTFRCDPRAAEGRTITIGSSLVYSTGQSLGSGGCKLKVVDSGANLFDDENKEGNGKKHRNRGGRFGQALEVCNLLTTLIIFSNSFSS
jgi:hypothetical protein